MKDKKELYEAFGQLVYVVAIADGLIQKEEVHVLEEIIKDHPWACHIKWSFVHEIEQEEDIDTLYKKVLNFCHKHGPDPEYKFLFEILEKIALANEGMDKVEEAIITKFIFDLQQRFKKDLGELY